MYSLLNFFALLVIDVSVAPVWHLATAEGQETRRMKSIEDLLDFYLTANNETRRNVTGLIKEAITSAVAMADNTLVIGILGSHTSHITTVFSW